VAGIASTTAVLEAINSAWGTVFWSHTYNALEDIPALRLPLGQHNPGMALDWRRFLSAVAADYLALQADEAACYCAFQASYAQLHGLIPQY